jgi:hypothetical protein
MPRGSFCDRTTAQLGVRAGLRTLQALVLADTVRGFAADVEGGAGLADLPASRSAAGLVRLAFDVELRVPLVPTDHATRVLHGYLQSGELSMTARFRTD